MEEPFFMTRKQVAKIIPCSLNSFDRQIRYGKEFTEIVSEKHLGGKILFPRKEVKEYLRSI